MKMVDLIITLIVLAFVISRFLGFQLPHDTKKGKKSAKRGTGARKSGARVLDFPKSPVSAGATAKSGAKPTAKDSEKFKNLTGIAAVKQADPSFSEKGFLSGAKSAYMFYADAYSKKDDDALENLLSPVLMNDIVDTFDALDSKGHSPKITVEKIEKVSLLDASLKGQTVLIDVQFTAKEAHNKVTKTGKIVGKEKPASTVKSVWTFARPAQSDDPNWEVQSIQKLN